MRKISHYYQFHMKVFLQLILTCIDRLLCTQTYANWNGCFDFFTVQLWTVLVKSNRIIITRLFWSILDMIILPYFENRFFNISCKWTHHNDSVHQTKLAQCHREFWFWIISDRNSFHVVWHVIWKLLRFHLATM